MKCQSKKKKIGIKERIVKYFTVKDKKKTNTLIVNVRVTTTFKWVIIQSFWVMFLVKTWIISFNQIEQSKFIADSNLLQNNCSYLMQNRMFESKNVYSSNS